MLKNILIIDDDERLRELLDEYLTEKNYKIYHSDDFNSGKEILEYFIFDLVIVIRIQGYANAAAQIEDISIAIQTNFTGALTIKVKYNAKGTLISITRVNVRNNIGEPKPSPCMTLLLVIPIEINGYVNTIICKYWTPYLIIIWESVKTGKILSANK